MMPGKHSQVTKSSRSHKAIQRRRLVAPDDVTYALALLFLRGMSAIPVTRRVRVINKSSPFLARLLQIVNVPSARKIHQNMRVTFGPTHSPTEYEANVRRLLSIVAWNAMIINSLPLLPRSQIAELLRIEGLTCLDDYLACDCPILIWGFHFGVDPFIIANVLYARGYPVHAVTHVRQSPATASLLQRRYFLRIHTDAHKLSVIDPRQGVQRKMLDVLRNKECLYITPDYMLPSTEVEPRPALTVSIEFLGQRAWLQTGGLRLVKRLKAKIAIVTTVQGDNGRLWLKVEPFELPTSGLGPDDLQQDLQMCMKRLEVEVVDHPYLWLDLKRKDLDQRLRGP